MSDCHREKVQAARQQVIERLAHFRADSSEERLASLKAAIDEWHHRVGAWSKAITVVPGSQNLR